MTQIFAGMCTSSEHGIYAQIYQASCEWCVCGRGAGVVGVWWGICLEADQFDLMENAYKFCWGETGVVESLFFSLPFFFSCVLKWHL